MATQIFDLERLVNNPNYAVWVHLGSGRSNVVSAILTNEISMGGGNDFNNPYDSANQEALSVLAQKVTPLISKAKGAITGEDQTMAFTSLKSLQQTALGWVGSKKPSLSLGLAWIAVRESDDVTLPIKTISKSIFPTEQKVGIGKIGVGVTRAPLGYGLKLTNNGIVPQGTVMVRIGKWFTATRLVVTDFDWSFSQQVIKSGLPLFATATLKVEPFRSITHSEFLGYFTARG